MALMYIYEVMHTKEEKLSKIFDAYAYKYDKSVCLFVSLGSVAR